MTNQENERERVRRINRLLNIAGDDRFKIWHHLESRAEEIRSRLWTIGTWLLGLLTGLLALVHQSGIVRFEGGFPGVTVLQPGPTLAASLIGILFLSVLLFAFFDHVRNVKRNWDAGTIVRDKAELKSSPDEDGTKSYFINTDGSKSPDVSTSSWHRIILSYLRVLGFYLGRSWSVILYAGIVISIPYFFLLHLATKPVNGTSQNAADSSNNRKVHAGEQPETRVTLLAVNDIYRIDGIERGQRGGLPRLRTLRRKLKDEDHDLILLHAGDVIFPSLLSREYEGEQMINVLNMLDGDDGFDERFFVTFGNHEFEKDKIQDAKMLTNRVRDSQFNWLRSNISFKIDEKSGTALVAGDNLFESQIIKANGVKVGLFGLTIPIGDEGVDGIRAKMPEYIVSFGDPVEEAKRLSNTLRRNGADVIVAVTHLNMATDKSILDRLGDDGPDLIIGGHEHTRQIYPASHERMVIKADADAVSAAVVYITLKWDSDKSRWIRTKIEHTYRDLAGDRPPPDDQVNRVVQWWIARHNIDFCSKKGHAKDCLDDEVGRTQDRLVAEEEKIRSCETNFGNWIADRALEAFEGAQAAIINAGSLRLNQNLPPGKILRRDIEELIEYPNSLRLIKVDKTTLIEVAKNAVKGWPGSGRWLQISGLSFEFDHTAERSSARAPMLTDKNGNEREILDNETVKMVVTDFLLNKEKGQDGYIMLNTDQKVQPPPEQKKLSDVLLQALDRDKEYGIVAPDPRIKPRIRAHYPPTNPCAK